MPGKLIDCLPEGNDDDRIRFVIMSVSYQWLPDLVKDKTESHMISKKAGAQ